MFGLYLHLFIDCVLCANLVLQAGNYKGTLCFPVIYSSTGEGDV
jgi:hypothetical protein